MSKLKEWCETCEGNHKRQLRWSEASEREFGKVPPCPSCGDLGFTLREVVDLPDGRAVVVGGGVRQRVLRTIYNGDPDSPLYDTLCPDNEIDRVCIDDCEKRARIILAALFTGPVYEAEAVGRFGYGLDDDHGATAACFLVRADDGRYHEFVDGSTIAVGLKEVGK